ncbi:hypothetical protein MCT05_06610 [Vibrio aestuarianus]|nr:hypothetical protein [Vibrio aestuarianus]
MNNKNILLIAPLFHGYELEISQELEKIGYKVIKINDLSSSFFYKMSTKAKTKILKNRIESFYSDSIKKLIRLNDIHQVLIIKGVGITSRLIEFLNDNNLEVKLYQWDSIKNHNYRELIEKCDKVYSFDVNDCKDNVKINYLPLFHSPYATYVNEDKEIDILFIGSYSDFRYKKLKEIRSLTLGSYRTEIYLYIDFFSFFIQNLIKGKKIKIRDVKFSPLNRKECYFKMKRSKVVIDLPSEYQTGLTMRFFEAIASQAHIITTFPLCASIDQNLQKCYTHLDSDNLMAIPNVILSRENEEYNTENASMSRYSLRSWLNCLGY